jgi:hypothetical protein
MIDIPAVFAHMDRALGTRGFMPEDGREHPAASAVGGGSTAARLVRQCR